MSGSRQESYFYEIIGFHTHSPPQCTFLFTHQTLTVVVSGVKLATTLNQKLIISSAYSRRYTHFLKE